MVIKSVKPPSDIYKKMNGLRGRENHVVLDDEAVWADRSAYFNYAATTLTEEHIRQIRNLLTR